jgi:hypothetical protein
MRLAGLLSLLTFSRSAGIEDADDVATKRLQGRDVRKLDGGRGVLRIRQHFCGRQDSRHVVVGFGNGLAQMGYAKLLHWAFCDELIRKQISAEGWRPRVAIIGEGFDLDKMIRRWGLPADLPHGGNRSAGDRFVQAECIHGRLTVGRYLGYALARMLR